MLSLDLRTLNFCIVIINIFFFVSFYIYWKTQKTYNGFGSWVASACTLTLAYCFYQLRGAIPDEISILFGNGLAITTVILRLDGVKRFYRNQKCHPGTYFILLVFLPILFYFYFVQNNIAIRTCLISFTAGFFILRFCGYYLEDFVENRNPLSLELGTITLIYLGIFWFRAVYWYLHPLVFHSMFDANYINESYYSYTIVSDIATNLLFLMLNSQRLAVELGAANERLFELASHDPLTGAYSRRTFIELSTKEFILSQRTGKPMSILMLDLDYFKLLNDEFGHTAGDQALIKFTSLCRNVLPSTAIIGRVGGDEFAVVLPETNLNVTKEIANRLKNTVETTSLYERKSSHKITVSIGIKELTSDEKSLDDLLHTVDMSLYVAKKQGRNKVVAAGEDSDISVI